MSTEQKGNKQFQLIFAIQVEVSQYLKRGRNWQGRNDALRKATLITVNQDSMAKLLNQERPPASFSSKSSIGEAKAWLAFGMAHGWRGLAAEWGVTGPG